ncbi:MAG: hypothetical protein QF752_09250 [Planctomycetota bacterium]|jgi:tetratricopeptide (TPR) repeat protein|nr:hypothetical protein [Planctomycetota bacterium]
MSSVTRRIEWLLVLAALAVSLPAVSGSFLQGDDVWLVEHNEGIRTLDSPNLIRFFDPTSDRRWLGIEYLPLRDLSYALDYAIWGLDSRGYHLTNSLLYALSCWLLFRWLIGLLGNPRLAAIVAFLYALHPVHTESVCWISSRKDVLAATFFFGSMALFRAGWSAGWTCRVGFWGAAFGVGIGAMLSKSMSVVLPATLLISEWLFPVRPGSKEDRRDLLLFVAVLGAATLFVLQLHLLVGRRDFLTGYAFGSGTLAATMLVVMLEYLRLGFFPVSLAAGTDFPVYSPHSAWVVLGGMVLLGLVLVAWSSFRERSSDSKRLTLFAILWGLITIAPFANFIPFRHLMAERYLLFPSLSFCLILGKLFESRKSNVLLGLVLFSLAALFVGRALEWGEEARHWDVTRKRDPQNHFVHLLRGSWLVGEGRDQEAAEGYREALRCPPRSTPFPAGQAEQGLAEIAARKAAGAKTDREIEAALDDSLRHFEEALRVHPRLAPAAAGAARIHWVRGSLPEAARFFLQASAAAPDQWQYAHDLGKVYSAQGRPIRSIAWYRRAWALRPSMTPLLLLLAREEIEVGWLECARSRLLHLLEVGGQEERIRNAARQLLKEVDRMEGRR